MVLNPTLLGILTPIDKFLSLNLYSENGYFVCLVFVLCFLVEGNYQTHSWSSYRGKSDYGGLTPKCDMYLYQILSLRGSGTIAERGDARLEEPEPVD